MESEGQQKKVAVVYRNVRSVDQLNQAKKIAENGTYSSLCAALSTEFPILPTILLVDRTYGIIFTSDEESKIVLALSLLPDHLQFAIIDFNSWPEGF